jgi:hypothetical protein
LDSLWTKYALEFVRLLEKGRQQDGNQLTVYSLGPSLSAARGFFSQPLVDVCAPTAEASSGITFEFRSEGVNDIWHTSLPKELLDDDADLQPQDDHGGVCFFTIVDASPQNAKVAFLSSKCAGSDALAIAKVKVTKLEHRTQTVEVDLTHVAHDDIVILSASNLSTVEFRSLRKWVPREIVFDAGLNPGELCTEVYQDVLAGLLRTQSHSSMQPEYLVQSDDVSKDAKLQVLAFLERHGRAANHGPNRMAWTMTQGGFQSLSISHKLEAPASVLRPRPNIAISDACVFELHYMICSADWVGQVHVPAPGRRKQVLAPIC